MRVLHALGYREIKRYHMNKGHAALSTLDLAHELARKAWELAYEPVRQVVTAELIHLIKPMCVFTTHIHVPAGHDKFSLNLVHCVLTDYHGAFGERENEYCPEGMLDLTSLAVDNSHYINGVAKRHGKITQRMFQEHKIYFIANGIHVVTKASQYVVSLFDQYIHGWREDNTSLRHAVNISMQEIWQVHRRAKVELVDQINRNIVAGLDFDTFTFAFARRMTAYKRPERLFQDSARLMDIAENSGGMQIIYAWKAHPNDQ